MGDTKAAPGATYEITIDGVPRSYRDDPRIAADAANFLKIKNPKSDVRVRDLRTNVVTGDASTRRVSDEERAALATRAAQLLPLCSLNDGHVENK
jgi:hypothetical protein